MKRPFYIYIVMFCIWAHFPCLAQTDYSFHHSTLTLSEDDFSGYFKEQVKLFRDLLLAKASIGVVQLYEDINCKVPISQEKLIGHVGNPYSIMVQKRLLKPQYKDSFLVIMDSTIRYSQAFGTFNQVEIFTSDTSNITDLHNDLFCFQYFVYGNNSDVPNNSYFVTGAEVFKTLNPEAHILKDLLDYLKHNHREKNKWIINDSILKNYGHFVLGEINNAFYNGVVGGKVVAYKDMNGSQKVYSPKEVVAANRFCLTYLPVIPTSSYYTTDSVACYDYRADLVNSSLNLLFFWSKITGIEPVFGMGKVHYNDKAMFQIRISEAFYLLGSKKENLLMGVVFYKIKQLGW
jgi:hypothetical protein